MEPHPGAQPRTPVVLTRADFDIAVRDPLRCYTRTDLLSGNPLLHARIVQRRRGSLTDEILRPDTDTATDRSSLRGLTTCVLRGIWHAVLDGAPPCTGPAFMASVSQMICDLTTPSKS
jgi:hypothetical protein